MMEALMAGCTPSANRVHSLSAPPLIMFRYSSISPVPPANMVVSAPALIYGTGIAQPRRNRTRIRRVNRRRLRRSSIFHALRKVSNTLHHLSLPARFLDFFLGGGCISSDLDIDRLGQLAVAQHLDAVQRLGDDAGLQQGLGINGRTGLELLEVRHLDGNILGCENVVETALRQTALQGHLAAFEAGLLDAAAGLLALMAEASGLAVAGTSTAALAGHGLAGTSGSFQFVKFHACTSLHYALVTTTRWAILAILP